MQPLLPTEESRSSQPVHKSMMRNLFGSLRQSIAKLHPSGHKAKAQDQGDSLAEKLHSMKWTEDEDDAALGESLASASNKGGGQGNSLAAAIYSGRPQNPFSDGS